MTTTTGTLAPLPSSMEERAVWLADAVRRDHPQPPASKREWLEAGAAKKAELSLVHVPVYFGDDPRGGMGACGRWNVGNWCGDVQERYVRALI